MAHEIYWDSREQRRIILEFSQTVTWEEFQAGVREAHALIAAARQPTALIIWAKTPFPDGLALWRFSTAFQAQPQNLTQIVIVPEENQFLLSFAKSLAGIVRRLYPTRNHIVFAETLDEARMLTTPAEALVSLE